MTTSKRTLLSAVVAAVLTAIVGFSFLARSEFFNPFDENSHYDYVVRIASDASLPPRDATISQQALSDWACSGVLGFEQLTCGADTQDPAKAPWAGANTALRYFPTYYVLTAIPTRIIHDIGNASWLDAARIATTGWLVLLSIGLVLLTRRLGMGVLTSLATSVFVCCMPMVVVQGTSMNNDIAGVAVAVLAVWSWLVLRTRPTPTRLLVSGGLALAAMTIKENAVVAVLAIAVLEWADGYQASQHSPGGSLWRALRTPTVLVAAIGAGYVLLLYALDPWMRGPASTAAEELVAAAVAGVEPQDWGQATAKAYNYLPYGLQSAGFIPVFNGAWAQLIPVLASMFVVGTLLFHVMRTTWPWGSTAPTIVAQSALAYIAAFPVLFLVLMKAQGLPLVFQPRYFLPGLVLGAVVLFVGLSRKWSIAALAGSGVVYAFMLLQVYSTI